MAQALTASMPQLLDLPDGYIVRWAAISPADGSAVAGVVVKNVSIFGTYLGGGGGGTTALGPLMLVPGPGA